MGSLLTWSGFALVVGGVLAVLAVCAIYWSGIALQAPQTRALSVRSAVDPAMFTTVSVEARAATPLPMLTGTLTDRLTDTLASASNSYVIGSRFERVEVTTFGDTDRTYINSYPVESEEWAEEWEDVELAFDELPALRQTAVPPRPEPEVLKQRPRAVRVRDEE
jgi:hypothetical protein